MKRLLALALMVALGNTAAAGPLGVSMGDPLKPDGGWSGGGGGFEEREYKGTLPFLVIRIEGTRDGGACAIGAGGEITRKDKALSNYDYLRSLLVDKYGEPDKEEPKEYPEARWLNFDPNPDKIDKIVLHTIKRDTFGAQTLLMYWFENYIPECRKAESRAL